MPGTTLGLRVNLTKRYGTGFTQLQMWRSGEMFLPLVNTFSPYNSPMAKWKDVVHEGNHLSAH